MKSLSIQRGYVSSAFKTRRGTAYRIKYRIQSEDGAWHLKTETLYSIAGKKEAYAIIKTRISDATARPSSVGETFGEFVERYYRPVLARRRIKPSTQYSYDSLLRHHLMPAFERLPMTEITPLFIEELVQSKSGLAPKTVRNLLLLAESIFAIALENGVVPVSPVKPSHKPRLQHVEKSVWEPAQIRQIVEAVAPPYRCLFTTIALTGVRLGEALALQWRHVSFPESVLRIEQNLWRSQIVAPKTKSSVRGIAMPAELKRALIEHHRCSTHKDANDFVFCKPDGAHLDPDVSRKDILYPTLDRLGILRRKGESGFHCFRHSSASIVGDKTGNGILAQRFLGHAFNSTATRTYLHAFEKTGLEATEAVAKAIFGESVPSLFQK